MSTHFNTKILFVCQKNDTDAVAQLAVLKAEGYDTRVLEVAELAPVGSIAIYSAPSKDVQYANRFYRVAAHRLFGNRPEWTITTPFLVALRNDIQDKYNNLSKATKEFARIYKLWFNGDAGVMLPWEIPNGPHSTYAELVEDWLDMVGTALGDDVLRKILEMQRTADEKHKGRGGDIVYRVLGDSGRVVTSIDNLPADLPDNGAYKLLNGFSGPIASYGTSDLANGFELFELLKLAHHLGISAVFETYPGAHNMSYWLNGFMNPSLKILGGQVWATDFGMSGSSKYTEVITPENMAKVIKSARLEVIENELMAWAGQPMWVVYQNAMKQMADEFRAALGIDVKYGFTTTEDMCRASGLWDMPAKKLAKLVEDAAGHAVVVFNKPDGSQLMSRQNMPEQTVGQLHNEGWWLGGAALYYMVFNMSRFGGVVVMVKDSSAGRVNLVARNFFTPEHQLYLAPVGLFRLSAEEQLEDWSVDPLVMLALFREWGKQKTAQVARTIWEAMEVPLEKGHIGRKTVCRVTKQGVTVRSQDV
jgi:hypothetical protein